MVRMRPSRKEDGTSQPGPPRRTVCSVSRQHIFRFALSHELRGERALTGTKVLFFWPAHGWLQGRVGKICPRTAFSHVVAYRKSSALGAAVVDTLLDEASHGPRGRWLMLLKE